MLFDIDTLQIGAEMSMSTTQVEVFAASQE